MLKRGLTVLVLLASASLARGAAVVELVAPPSTNPFNPPGYYDLGETVTIEINLSQSAGEDHLVRLVQLDFNATHVDLGLSAPAVAWEFGERHYFESPGQRPGMASATYYGDPDPVNPDLGPNADYQLLLPGDGSLKVGEFEVTLPGTAGDYALDVMNAGDSDVNKGAKLAFGFGLDPSDPVTIWRAYDGDLTGGTLTLHVVDQALSVSLPGFDESLWRLQSNFVRLTFDRPITAPGAGEVLVQALLDGGAFGPDLSASFSFTVVDSDKLEIKETSPVLSHRTWYVIRSTGAWTAVAPFRVHYVVQLGDANNDGLVLVNDLSWINSDIPNVSPPDDSRFDINGDGLVLVNDLSVANASIPSVNVEKPSGHG